MRFTRLIAIALAAVSVTAFVCCGEGYESGNGGESAAGGYEKYASRPKTFTFSYYASGYGADWVDAVLKDYMDNVNTEVFVNPKRSIDNNQSRLNIQSNIGYDLYQLEVDMFENSEYLYDLSSLLDTEVYGESGVKVRDKIGEKNVGYYTEKDGKVYQLPQTSLTGWNFVYNKTLLDEKLGAGEYTLPKTTDEFFAFGDMLKEKGVFLSAFSGDSTNGADYTTYLYQDWFAQIMGAEGYDKYYSGYYNADGEWVFAENEPDGLLNSSEFARVETYKIAEKFAAKSNGYMHSSSPSMQYTDVNRVFYGGKFNGSSVAPFALHFTGAWLESEVQDSIDRGSVTKKDVRAMKLPVASAIIEKLSAGVDTDEKLSAIISYVDGETSEKPSFATDDDVKIVKEARNMVGELICREFVVTKNAQNKDEIVKFLAYLCSDRAQKIASKAAKGAIVLPYGYKPTDEDMGFEISDYLKSVADVTENAEIIDLAQKNKAFCKYVLGEWVRADGSGGTLTASIFSGQAFKSAEVQSKTLTYYKSRWANLIAQYNAKK